MSNSENKCVDCLGDLRDIVDEKEFDLAEMNLAVFVVDLLGDFLAENGYSDNCEELQTLNCGDLTSAHKLQIDPEKHEQVMEARRRVNEKFGRAYNNLIKGACQEMVESLEDVGFKFDPNFCEKKAKRKEN